MLALSLPPFGWWPLAWAAYGGLAAVLPGLRIRARLALGFGFGAGQYVIGLLWVQEFTVWGCAALMLLSALFDTAAMALVPASRRLGVVLGLPAVVVLADWARDRYPLGGLPLGGAALGQAVSPLSPLLRIGGPLLLEAATVLAGVAAAQLAIGAYRVVRGSARRAWFGAPAAGVAVAVAVGLAGALAPLAPDGTAAATSPIRVALVQGGGPRGTRAINTDPQVVFDRHLDASRSLKRPLDLVVWPEGVLQSHGPYEQTLDAAELSSLAATTRATVVAGVEQEVGATRYLNEVVAWGPSGGVIGAYVKNHLVPFGEYIPDRSLVDRFFNVSDVPLDAIAGHDPGILRTPAGPLGVTISFEILFDDRVLAAVRAGGQVLLVPTNTASYSSTQVPAQELAAARLAAEETGRFVLQVTPTGYTAVVAPSGRVLKRTTLDRQQVLTASVPRRVGRTWYVDLGDSPFALGALALYMLAVAAAGGLGSAAERLGARRRRKAMPAPVGEVPLGPPALVEARPRPAAASPPVSAGSSRSKGVLFVCTGNQCRSPMAEALLRRHLAEAVQRRHLAGAGGEDAPGALSVASAGFVSEGRPPPPEAQLAMREVGLDISGHRSRLVDAALLHGSALVVTMSRQHLIDIATAAPDVWQRCFTFAELMRRARSVGARRPGETLEQWCRRIHAGRLRAGLLSLPLDEDVPDPMGGSLEEHRALRDRLDAWTAELALLLEG